MANNLPGVKVSADQLRYIVYGHRFWAPGEPMMWAIRTHILKMLMEQGQEIIIDETNTTFERRKAILDLAREHGYETIGIYINASKEDCIRRATAEGEDFLIPVIERMAAQFEPILPGEFSASYEVNQNPING